MGIQAAHTRVESQFSFLWSFHADLSNYYSLKRMDLAFNELERFLSAEVTAKQEELAFEQSGADASRNLFSRVVLASQEEAHGAAGAGLTPDEIRGNLFIYLLAGVSRTGSYVIMYAYAACSTRPLHILC